jgi:pilus assembly protein CpaC
MIKAVSYRIALAGLIRKVPVVAFVSVMGGYGAFVEAQTVPVAPPNTPAAGLGSAQTTAIQPKIQQAVRKPVVRKSNSNAAQRAKAYAPVKVFDDAKDIPEIEMFVGESRVLPAPGVGRVAVGNGKIMTAAVLDSKEILLFANEQGTSSLFIWNDQGKHQRIKINVVSGDTSRVSREIAAFVSRIPGAKVSVVGQNVVVEGDRLSNQDLEKIRRIEKIYPQLINFTHPDGWEKMVLIDVKVVEFPKNYLRDLGLRWTPTGGGTVGAIWAPARRGNDGPYVVNIPQNAGGLPITGPDGAAAPLPRGLNAIAALNMGLNVSLNALVQDGKASLLAEPQLSTRSGKAATFEAGGEFPYSIVTAEGPSVTFKPYGVLLSINPIVDRDGFIRSEISAEVSSIDGAVSTPFGPALRKRKVDTHFNVASGQTIVLSGMLSAEKSVSADKLPYLGDIPVLGALFRSKRFVDNETELVVFVTPRLVDPHDDKVASKIESVRDRLHSELEGRELLEPLEPSAPRDMPSASEQPKAGAASSESAASAATDLERGGSVLKVKSSSVVVRAQPHPRAQELTVLEPGQLVRMAVDNVSQGESIYWRKVIVGSLVGWVPARTVEPVGVALGTSQHPGTESPQGKRIDAPVAAGKALSVIQGDTQGQIAGNNEMFRVVLSRLALRVAPDINAMVLAQIPQGSLLKADSRAPVGLWLPVAFDGREGWVDVRWLEPVSR